MKGIWKLALVGITAFILLAVNLSSYGYHCIILPKRVKPYPSLRRTLVNKPVVKKPALKKPKWQVMNLPRICTVYVDGNIDLKIITGQSRSKLVVNRYTNYPPGVKYNDYMVSISKNEYSVPSQARIQVALYVNQIQNLYITGNSRVVGQNLATYCDLNITNCGNGSICLTGTNRLKHLQNTGNACITVNGICSEHVEVINTHYGQIRLFGNTGALLIRAVQQSFTDARCLRAHTSFVQTEGSAIVYVRAVNSLRAFASGCSTIFYFSTPCDLVKHTAMSGNIFQFADW